MEHIFGPHLRAPIPVAMPRLEPEVRRRSRRWVGVAAIGVLSVTTAAGVIAGRNVTTPISGARPIVSDPVRAPAPRAPSAPEVAARDIAVPAITPAVSPTPEIVDQPVAATRTVAAAPGTTRPVAARVPAPAAEPTVTGPPPVPAPAPASVAYRSPATPAPTRIVMDCDRDPEGCFAARVEWADRRTGEAFETAAAAGVRPRTLRQYRSEWDRARRASSDRPGDSLRILAMITHDLRQLTNEVAAQRPGLQ